MKRYIFTLILMTSFTGFTFANGNNGKAAAKSTPTVMVPAETSAALSMKQLQEENMLLKQQLMSLFNENEELKGTLNFQSTMTNMFSQLGQQKLSEQLEEMNATLNYNHMMANMLLKIKQSSK